MIKKIQVSNITTHSTNTIKSIANTASTKQKQLMQNVKDGIEKGRRLSVLQHRGTIKAVQAKLIGIKRTLPPELWYGFLGTFTPIPGGTILGIGVGKLIKVLKKIK